MVNACVAVDRKGEKPVGQIAIALFFVLALCGASFLLLLTVMDNLAEIAAALRGERPVRSATRPWVRSVRAPARPRPVTVRVQQRAAA
jgi:hypothetical protein